MSNHPIDEFRSSELHAERCSNIWRTENYLIPIVDKIFSQVRDKKSVRILSVGCGNGEDIDTLIEHGYSGIGIDTGYRSEEWKLRKNPDCFMVADGTKLPFGESAFDMVLSFGVIEHIGAVGDSLELLPDYQRHREQYAEEILRVTKPGGYIMITTPNKHFPLDMWHGPFMLGARFHSISEKFLMSYGEIDRLFKRTDKISYSEPLGLDNFFQFKKTGKHLWIKMLLPLIKGTIYTISRFDFLKKSALNPFLVILFRKK